MNAAAQCLARSFLSVGLIWCDCQSAKLDGKPVTAKMTIATRATNTFSDSDTIGDQ